MQKLSDFTDALANHYVETVGQLWTQELLLQIKTDYKHFYERNRQVIVR